MAEERKDFKHIVRIADADLNGNKPLYHGLRSITGIGFMFANMVCKISKIDRLKKVGYLTDDEIKKIDDIIKDPMKFGAPLWMLNRVNDWETGENKHLTGGDIKFVKENDIKIMKMIRSYKGVRHTFGLPVRGQSTKSNFRKNKGKVLGVKRSKKVGKV